MSKKSFFVGVIVGYAIVMTSIAIVNPSSLPNRIAASIKGRYDKKCEDRFFAATSEGRIVPIQPLDAPNLDTPAILSWTAVATTRALTFGFHDVDERLNHARNDFTPQGWEEFNALLKDSGLIDKIIQQKLQMKAVPKAQPRLTKQGNITEFDVRLYQWQLEAPLVVSFINSENTVTEDFKIALTLQRIPLVDSPTGVAIASIKKL